MQSDAPQTKEERIEKLKQEYRNALKRAPAKPASDGFAQTMQAGLKYVKTAFTFQQQPAPSDSADKSVVEDREYKYYLERLRWRLTEAGLDPKQVKAEGTKLDSEHVEAKKSEPEDNFINCLRAERTAMLVIHGIGEQNPYETLDQFSRNVMRYLKHEGGITDATISPKKINHNDSIEARVRLETKKHSPTGNPAYIDIFEYYWAPETEGKFSYKQTIAWLVKTTLTPLKYLDQNVRTITNDSDEGISFGAAMGRELARITWIYLPVLALLAILFCWLPGVLDAPATLKPILDNFKHDPLHVRVIKGLMTFFFAASAYLYWVVLRYAVAAWIRSRRQQNDPGASPWLIQTFALASALLASAIALGTWTSVTLRVYFAPLLTRNTLLLLAIFPTAWVIQYFLSAFVGDVALYCSNDEKSSSFAVRKKILAGATTALLRIIKSDNPAYQQVIVAGHSLGSVIAYDLMNEVLNRENVTSDPDQLIGVQPPKTLVTSIDVEKITGLITFGSPLDKVHYFFREFIPEQQKIRAQLVQFLGYFRKRPSGDDYGMYRFERYTPNQLAKLQWLNAWSIADPISGHLHFFKDLEVRHFSYGIPVYAHLSYWEDLRFYRFFSEPLLLGEPVPTQEELDAFYAAGI